MPKKKKNSHALKNKFTERRYLINCSSLLHFLNVYPECLRNAILEFCCVEVQLAWFRIGFLKEQLDMKCCQISPWIKFLSLERHGSFYDLHCTVLDTSLIFLWHTISLFLPFCPTIIQNPIILEWTGHWEKKEKTTFILYKVIVIKFFHVHSSKTLEEKSLC